MKISTGALVHRLVVEHPQRPEAAAQFASEKDVRCRRQIVAERQVLVDDLDAVLSRFHRPVKNEFLAIQAHGAVARSKVAGDHLDQRGLAGAVVAHQADDLSRFERKRNIVDRLDGAEMFGDIGEFENRHQPSSLPKPQARPLRTHSFEAELRFRSPVSSSASIEQSFTQNGGKASINCRLI